MAECMSLIDYMKQSDQFPFALKVVETLHAAGYEAVFAGGCVRDALMGRVPKDFDIASNAIPKQIEGLFPKTVPVGEAFNVILVLPESSYPPGRMEVATFRQDLGIGDGRHPAAVGIATAREDVERRDFTINGMLFNPITNELFDWVGGRADLQQKIIRSIGPAHLRIKEDYLRMLRAIRFAARLNYSLEPSLWDAIVASACEIHNISAERIFDELTKMLTSAHADRAFELLYESGLLKEILPEAIAMRGCQQPAEYHPEGDVWVHTMLLLSQCEGQEPEIGWGSLLHDIGKPPTFSHEPPDRIRFNNHQHVGDDMARAILTRLKASRRFTDIVCELVRDHLKFKDAPQMKRSTLMRFLRNPNFALHLKLHYIDCMASHKNMSLYEFCKLQLEQVPPQIMKPRPLLTGNDLIELGYKPGPQFKRMLERLETEQLEGRIHDVESAKLFIKKFESETSA